MTLMFINPQRKRIQITQNFHGVYIFLIIISYLPNFMAKFNQIIQNSQFCVEQTQCVQSKALANGSALLISFIDMFPYCILTFTVEYLCDPMILFPLLPLQVTLNSWFYIFSHITSQSHYYSVKANFAFFLITCIFQSIH